jgi:hypothetical protein
LCAQKPSEAASPEEVVSALLLSSARVTALLSTRSTLLSAASARWASGDAKGLFESLGGADDVAALLDVVGATMKRQGNYSLDVGVVLMPKLLEVVQRGCDEWGGGGGGVTNSFFSFFLCVRQVMTALQAAQALFKCFGFFISNTLAAPTPPGVDLNFEDRSEFI